MPRINSQFLSDPTILYGCVCWAWSTSGAVPRRGPGFTAEGVPSQGQGRGFSSWGRSLRTSMRRAGGGGFRRRASEGSRSEAGPRTRHAPASAAEVSVFLRAGGRALLSQPSSAPRWGMFPRDPALRRGGGGLGEPAGEAGEGTRRPASALPQPRLLSPPPGLGRRQ